LPDGYKITEIILEETAGNNAGNISVGNVGSGAQYVTATAVNANQIISTANFGSLINYFNNTGAAENIFVSSSAWGNGSIRLHITFEKVQF